LATIREAKDCEVNTPDEQLRAIIDTIPALVWSARPDGSAELFTRRWLDYTGLSYDEARDWGWTTAVHPEDREGLDLTWQRIRASEQLGQGEVRLRRHDGEYRWFLFRASPVRDESGAIVKWYGTNTDIEDRKRAEESAEASELSFRRIVETIPALVWCASPEGELTFVNQRILDYTGVLLDDLAQAGWVNFLHPEDVEQTVTMWSNAVRTGNPHDIQYRLRRHDGAYRWFHVLGQAMLDAEGRIRQWYGLLIDIDDRKNIEEALRRTETRLSKATHIATVGELAASIAHEINQPLGAVVTNAYACLRWLSTEPANFTKAREAAERIVRDGKETGEVVARIRALFKQTQAQHMMLNLNGLITEVVRLLGAESSRRRVAIETELQTDLQSVPCDRIQIQQLILNLLMNGLDAMDSVTDHPKRILIRSQTNNVRTALVEVEDRGEGLADCERVFEPFFTTKEHGMGMGLAICRSIVEGHNGKLWATPNKTCGTTFSFTLPFHASKVSEPQRL
jgi:PAS domain S-box-containing protein